LEIGGASEGPFLHAAILFFLISGAVCHAQVTCPSSPTITSVTPSTWAPGQTYNITITGTSFLGSTPPDQYCPAVTTSVTLTGTGSIALSNVSIVSATQITASVTPAAGDPAQTACVTVMYGIEIGVAPATANSGTCPADNNVSASAPVQIGCPVPTIMSVSPNVWIAGQTYNNVTITGAGFSPAIPGPPGGLGPPQPCPATTVAVTMSNGGTVAVSSVDVVSTTKITATIAPAAADSTGGATVKLSGATPATAAAKVCGVPTIASISPTVWIEGKSTPVTIMGTGFTTTAAATAACPASTIGVTTGTGTVKVSNVSVVGATEITASIEAPANVANETANLTVTGTPAATATAQIEGCPLLSTESTAFQGWNNSTIGTWLQTLSDASSDSFSGSTVQEADAGTGADACWFPNSAFAPFTSLSGGQWPVSSSNTWGPDSVGWPTNYVGYYRAQGRAPCGFTVYQQMQMQCSADFVNSGDYFNNYGNVNTLQANITATTVTSARAGKTETENY
jgi:hypothetical protein